MGKKKEELTKTTPLVKRILIENPKARDDDMYLYVQVVKALNPDSCKMPFINVISNLKALGLPCIETVGRVRRKLQEDHPELWSSKQVKKYREEAEKDFEDYARS